MRSKTRTHLLKENGILIVDAIHMIELKYPTALPEAVFFGQVVELKRKVESMVIADPFLVTEGKVRNTSILVTQNARESGKGSTGGIGKSS